MSICWGHDTGVTQDSVLDFSGNWTGTGAVVGTGDAERLELNAGEYMITAAIAIEAGSTVTLRKNSYFSR